jgi:hypothetical protein
MPIPIFLRCSKLDESTPCFNDRQSPPADIYLRSGFATESTGWGVSTGKR